jgi:hypothetical protein
MTKYWAMELKPVNGCQIEKSFERNSRTGKIKPDTIVYSVYTNDGDDGLVGCLR